jgi:NAD(P)-dependent dehydrogenase (short-subunit alcohol dehydrogenase family)
MDVRDSKAVGATVAHVVEELGGLEILVNNAGAVYRAPVEALSNDQWNEVIGTTLTGTFNTTRAVATVLPPGKGRIVNIASVLALFGVANSAAYVAAKHGVLGVTRVAALELAPQGITVNAVCPGWTATDMWDEGTAYLAKQWQVTLEKARQRALSGVPLQRTMKPTEVADLVAYLCTPEASGITGQALRIDGGQTLF